MSVILPDLHPYSLWGKMTAHVIRLESPLPGWGETSGGCPACECELGTSLPQQVLEHKGEKR
jgi:hypothetical protein